MASARAADDAASSGGLGDGEEPLFSLSGTVTARVEQQPRSSSWTGVAGASPNIPSGGTGNAGIAAAPLVPNAPPADFAGSAAWSDETSFMSEEEIAYLDVLRPASLSFLPLPPCLACSDDLVILC